jgi:hypothetical protein
MRTVCITTWPDRPHVMSVTCWCHPELVECDCGHDCGSVVGHKDLTIRGDVQPRMSAYSEQYQRGMAPDDG